MVFFTTSTFFVVLSYANGNQIVPAVDVDGNRVASSLSAGAGSSMWNKTYGGTGYDNGTGAIVQTSDGGYVIAGHTNSSGAGDYDYWLIKTDASGNMLWNKTYGGALEEVCYDMCQTNDGGYAMAGSTRSFGAGGQDVWLVKMDADGGAYWAKTYGGTGDEFAIHVVQTLDDGYAIAGYTGAFGVGDALLVKADASGNMQWNKTYGGTGDDMSTSVVQNSDGSYTMAGLTNSSGAGGADAWLVKTDATGNMLWNKTYGGTGTDIGESMIQTSDDGYAIIGYTTSFGGWKVYLVKTDASGVAQWNKTYGGIAEIGMHGIQTADGGYALVGWNYLNGQDFLLIKTDSAGNMLWKQTYGGTGIENGYSVIQTSDGGYALAGFTTSFGAGGTDFWVIKADPSGAVPEGLAFVLIMLLSSVAALASRLYFRKPPRIAT
jgi:hypothetical protein